MHKRLWFSCSVLLLGCSGERNQNSTVDRSHENVGQNPVSDETKELSESAAVTEQLLSEPAVKIALAEAERRSANLVSAPSFRFLRSSLTCQDNAGRKGLNPGPDVGECTDLRNRDFTGVDLSAKNLRGANFTQSVLRTAKFGSSDLRGADLWKSNWESALFRGALFNEATKLPFEKSVALSQGMVEVSYKSLDTQLDAALIAWNKSTDPDLPKAIIDLIALDASPAAVSGNFLTALVAKRSEHLFDLALYNGVDFSNIDQKPLILRLVDAGDVELLKILVGKGLSLSHNNPNIEQALGYAISGRKTPVLKALLTLGADPNARSTAGSSGISPLSRIASGGYTEVIRDMVAAGADVHEINQGLSLVQNAASLEIAKLLVELGADPTRVNLFKKPSDQLMWIASQGANV
ncbi:MAG: pentapeptide repeat-containing protein, partial [Proteobacteria bacterium]|nr:pentapeptide repeat-containing protein [Pseudomonadota bacterium]